MKHHEALHWAIALPIQALRLLPCSLYKKISDRWDLTIVIEMVLRNQECEKEQTLCTDIQNLQTLSKSTHIRLSLSTLDHFITQTIATGKDAEFCPHSKEFFSHYANALLEKNHTETFKEIIASFETMYRPHLIRSLSGSMAEFPLPPNNVPRVKIVQNLLNLVSKALNVRKTPTLTGNNGTWIVITGDASCGKTSVLANLLRAVQVSERVDAITAEKFDEDSNIANELKKIVAQKQSKTFPSQTHACDLLVLDNVFEWSKDTARQAEIIGTLFKCIIVTTRDAEWARKFRASQTAVIVTVPDGLETGETISLFCSVFKCNEKDIPAALKIALKRMHAYTKGSPLKLRIIFTTAWRTLKLTTKSRDVPRWMQYLDQLKYSTGATSFDSIENLIETPVDDGWTRVDSPAVSPSPSAEQMKQPSFLERNVLPRIQPRGTRQATRAEVGKWSPRSIATKSDDSKVDQISDNAASSASSPRYRSAEPEPAAPEPKGTEELKKAAVWSFKPALTPLHLEMQTPPVIVFDPIGAQVEELQSPSTCLPIWSPGAVQGEAPVPTGRRSSLPSRRPSKSSYLCSFDEKSCLGVGRSKVYRATWKDNGLPVAVKRIEVGVEDDHEQEVRSVYREFDIVSKLNHQNILKYYDMDVKHDDRIILLLMELCDGGSLKSIAKQRPSLTETQSYLQQLLDGLQYLHAQQIYHLDLKGENVFLTRDGLVKIGDFGEMAALERSFTSEHENNGFVANIGTVMYMSPEMIRGDDVAVIGEPSDVWSFGCVALELLTGRTPKYQKEHRDGSVSPLLEPMPIMFFIGSGGRPHIPEDLNQVAVEFLDQCFKRDIAKRWSAEQLMHHSFLTYQGTLEGGVNDDSPEITMQFRQPVYQTAITTYP